MLSLGRPTVRAAFPADGDTFDYTLSISVTGVNTTGTDLSETLSLGIGVDFINSSGDYYWANHTFTFPNDPMFYPLNGTTVGSGLCHYHPDNEAPLMITPVSYNWSLLSYSWISDLFLIEAGTQPGDTITFGSGYSDDSTFVGPYDEYPYADPYGGYYMQFTLPVGPGAPLTVGAATLSTVMIGMDFEQHYNASNPTYSMWDMTAEFNSSWEWSLGFLADMSFDIYMNLNPNIPSMLGVNLTSLNIEGGITLSSYTTTDPIAVGPWDVVAPPIPGFPIVAVLMGLFAALVPVVLVRKRRK